MSLFASIELANAISSNIPGDFGCDIKLTKSAKSTHNRMFANWLLLTFGQSYLRKGVVDIAGGKGMLSYALGLRYGIKCTLIEPREFELSSMSRKRMKSIVKQRDNHHNGTGYVGYDDQKDIFKASSMDAYVDDGISLEFVTDAAYWGNLPFKHIRSFFYYPLPPLPPLPIVTVNPSNSNSNSNDSDNNTSDDGDDNKNNNGNNNNNDTV